MKKAMTAGRQGFAPIFIILIGVIFAVGVYFVLQNSRNQQLSQKSVISSPTPFPETPPADPTANWKTYTNTQYGYSIKYPSTWRAGNVAAGNVAPGALPDSRIVEIFDTNYPSDHKFEGITIQVLDSPVLPKDKLTINNIEMYVFNTQEGEVYTVKIPNENVYVEITGAGGHTANEDKNQIIRQIFSTFKFTQ